VKYHGRIAPGNRLTADSLGLSCEVQKGFGLSCTALNNTIRTKNEVHKQRGNPINLSPFDPFVQNQTLGKSEVV
jgi:hypothetical protein